MRAGHPWEILILARGFGKLALVLLGLAAALLVANAAGAIVAAIYVLVSAPTLN